MNNAVFSLIIILLLAFLGGALAFNTNRHGGLYYCINTTSTLDLNGNPIECSIKAATGAAGVISGCCTLTPTKGAACC